MSESLNKTQNTVLLQQEALSDKGVIPGDKKHKESYAPNYCGLSTASSTQ